MVPPSRKKPDPDFVIRLDGPNLKPWAIPMRRLARTLQAVQSLMEPGDDVEDHDLAEVDSECVDADAPVGLRLLDVRSGSACYNIASSDPKQVIQTLTETGRWLRAPERADWPGTVLKSIERLSDIAKSLSCRIEFRAPGQGRHPGNLFAAIEPNTYADVSRLAFIEGHTSVPGRIERVGGATEMHCGLRVPYQSRKMVICRVKTPELVRDLGKYLYQDIIVIGRATWVRSDQRLIRMVIENFEPPKTGSILDALDRVYDAGGSSWDNVDDPEATIAEMRGL